MSHVYIYIYIYIYIYTYLNGISALELYGFGRIIGFEFIDEEVFEFVFSQSVIFGIMSKQRRESLRLEHETRIIGPRYHPSQRRQRPLQIQVFSRLNRKFHVFRCIIIVVVVVVVIIIVLSHDDDDDKHFPSIINTAIPRFSLDREQDRFLP
jgi:hypothetical protein